MLGLKLNHVSKRGHWSCHLNNGNPYIVEMAYYIQSAPQAPPAELIWFVWNCIVKISLGIYIYQLNENHRIHIEDLWRKNTYFSRRKLPFVYTRGNMAQYFLIVSISRVINNWYKRQHLIASISAMNLFIGIMSPSINKKYLADSSHNTCMSNFTK